MTIKLKNKEIEMQVGDYILDNSSCLLLISFPNPAIVISKKEFDRIKSFLRAEKGFGLPLSKPPVTRYFLD